MSYQILAIGSPLVDIIARVEPEFLELNGIAPGGMTLVDAETSDAIYSGIRNAREISGGSAANTAAIAAELGARVAFAGRLAEDGLGDIFTHDLASLGVAFAAARTPEDTHRTGSCISLITPDGERSMCTHLGAAREVHLDDIDKVALTWSDTVFLEGYLLDAPNGHAIVREAIRRARGQLALTLSDAGCVRRHHAFLMKNLAAFDLLFGNAEEIAALCPTESLLRSVALLGETVPRVVCTDGGNGVYLAGLDSADGPDIQHVPAQPVKVVDTTGAGDSFAGTVLWALSEGHGLVKAAEMAMTVAAEVISEIGARPSRELKPLLRTAGHLGEPEAALT